MLSDHAQQLNAVAVAVTESWLKPDVMDSEVTINFPGYTIYRSDRISRPGGGVCMFLRDDISGECLVKYDNGVCELLMIKVHSFDTILAVVYRPPDTRISEFLPVLTELEKCVSNLSNPQPAVLMAGDFNFPNSVMNWVQVDGELVPNVHNHHSDEKKEGLQSRLQASKLCDLSSSCHMTQLVDSPTCGKEALDLVFATDCSIVSHIKMEDFPAWFSDHKVISVNLTSSLSRQPQKPEIYLLDSARRLKKLDFKEAPWIEIRRHLKDIDWGEMTKISRYSPTAAHNYMLFRILPILENYVPKKKVGKGTRSRTHRQEKLLWRKLKKSKE